MGYFGAVDSLSITERAIVLGNQNGFERSLDSLGYDDIGRLLHLAAEAGHVARVFWLEQRVPANTTSTAK